MNLYRLESDAGRHLTGLLTKEKLLLSDRPEGAVVRRFKVTGCDVTVEDYGLLEADKAWSMLIDDSNA